MIAIAITPAAYEAIKADAVYGAPRSVGPDGQMRIWLDHAVVDRLRALRRSGESYSDLILRLAEASNSAARPYPGRTAPSASSTRTMEEARVRNQCEESGVPCYAEAPR